MMLLGLLGSVQATVVKTQASQVMKGLASKTALGIQDHFKSSQATSGHSRHLLTVSNDFSKQAGRSLLQLAPVCGVMTMSVSCGQVTSASCASTTGCALDDSGECGVDFTQVDMPEEALNDSNFVEMTAMTTSCMAKNATQCSADITCDFDGSCGTGPYLIFWLLDKCPTMATVIAKMLAAEGITQAQVQAEANAAGFTISPEFQAELDAQGVATE